MSKFKTHDPHSLDHELLQEHYPPEEAIALQERWRQILAVQSGDPHNITVQDITKIRLVVGLDIAYPPTPDPTLGIACAVLWDVPAVKMVSFHIVTGPISFSYIPGLLGFREARLLSQAVIQLDHKPDLILCDGHGIAHPRRFGEAVHVGAVLNIPSVGVAKSPFYGVSNWNKLPRTRGAQTGIYEPAPGTPEPEAGAILGKAVCLVDGRKPVFVSVGYRTTLDLAVAISLQTTIMHRQPEPLFLADHYSRDAIKSSTI